MVREEIKCNNLQASSWGPDEVRMLVLSSGYITTSSPLIASDASRTIELGPDLNELAVSTLLDCGLGARHVDIVNRWHQDIANMHSAKEDDIAARNEEIREAMNVDLGRLRNYVKDQCISSVSKMYPYVTIRLYRRSKKLPELIIRYLESSLQMGG